MAVRPTRWYSNKQEKQVAKTVGGRKTSNSGATSFIKGDVVTDDWLIECKTVTKEQKTVTLHREWFDKNEEEAFAMRRPYNALAFDFGDGVNRYVISEKLFKLLVDQLKESEIDET